MNVYIAVFVEFFVNTKRFRVFADVADGGLCGFLHHVAEISGKLYLARTLKALCFDLQHLAAKLRPGKSVHNADRVGRKKRIRA